MGNIFEGMEDILPEVLFSELLQEDTKYYEFRLIGWNTPKYAGHGRDNYKVIESIALQDYTELSLFKGQLFNLHLSLPVFQRYLIKFLSYHKGYKFMELLKDTSKTIIIDIKFSRTYRGMNILYVKLLEVKGVDEYNVLMQLPRVNE